MTPVSGDDSVFASIGAGGVISLLTAAGSGFLGGVTQVLDSGDLDFGGIERVDSASGFVSISSSTLASGIDDIYDLLK